MEFIRIYLFEDSSIDEILGMTLGVLTVFLKSIWGYQPLFGLGFVCPYQYLLIYIQLMVVSQDMFIGHSTPIPSILHLC